MGIRGGDVEFQARANSDKLDGDLDKAEGKVKRFGNRIGQIGKAAGLAIGGLGLGVIAGAGAAIGGFIQKTRELNAELKPAANRIGTTTAELNTLRRVAERLGSEDGLEGVTDSAQELALRLQDMTASGYRADDALEQIGLSGDELRKKSPKDAMLAVISALQGIEDQQQKNWVADELFGGAWENIAGILNVSQEEFKGLIAVEGQHEAQQQKAIDSAERLERAQDKLGKVFEGIMLRVAPPVIDFLIKLIKYGEDYLPLLEKWWKSISRQIQPALEKLTEQFRIHILPAILELWRLLTEDLLPALQSFWETLGPILQPILESLIAIIKQTIIPLFKNSLVTAFNVVRAVITILSGLLSGDFSKAWLGVQQLVEAVVNGIIGAVNAMARGVALAIQGIVRSVAQVGRRLAGTNIPGVSSIGRFLAGLGNFSINLPNIPTVNFGALPSLPPPPQFTLPNIAGAAGLPGATQAAAGAYPGGLTVQFPTTLIADDVGIAERVAEAQHLANRLGVTVE